MHRHPIFRGVLLFLIGLAAPAAAATRVDLGGAWQFRDRRGRQRKPPGMGGRRARARSRPSTCPHLGRGPARRARGARVVLEARPRAAGPSRTAARAALRRDLLQGPGLRERHPGRGARGRAHRLVRGRHASPRRGRPGRGGARQPARRRHDPGLGDAARGLRDAVVRLVALRRHRARRGPRGAGARDPQAAGDPGEGRRGRGEREHAGLRRGDRGRDRRRAGGRAGRRGGREEPRRPCRSERGARRRPCPSRCPDPACGTSTSRTSTRWS